MDRRNAMRTVPGAAAAGQLPVTIEERNFEPGDALQAEIRSFLACIQQGKAPAYAGHQKARLMPACQPWLWPAASCCSPT